MRLLSDEIRRQVAEVLQGIEADVELVLVGREGEEETDVAVQLLGEVAETSPRLTTLRLAPEEAAAQALGAERTPSVFIRRRGEPAAHFSFLGAPAGYEFGSLVEDIRDVARGQTGLSDDTKAFLASLGEPVLLQVFSTPT